MNLNAASAGRLAFTQHEPIGVVLAYSAFNHPLNLIVHQVGPAIAAGCPVIVKPAKATPLSCFRFVDILREAGLPDEWCQALITADQELATAMVADRRLGFFTFHRQRRGGLGSAVETGPRRSLLARTRRRGPGDRGRRRRPGRRAAAAVQRRILSRRARSAFRCSGFLPTRRSPGRLAERLAELAGKLKVGDPTLPDTEVGPLIRESEVRRVDEWVQEAADRGAKVLCGGKAVGTRCYAPTVLFDPPDDCRVSTHEVFGPVVCVSSLRKTGRGHRPGERAALCFPGGRLHARLGHGPAGDPAAGRRRGDGQRPHGVPRRLDALCRAERIGLRRRRHPVHDGGNADQEVGGDQVERIVE